MAIIRIIKKFKELLSARQKHRIFELAVLMVAGGILETCSVSLVLPFMEAVMNPEFLMDKDYVRFICDTFRLESAESFLIFASLFLALVYLVKNIYLILEYNIQFRFVYGNMLEMQNKILESIIHRPYEYFLGINSGEIIRIVNTDTPNTFNLLTTLLTLFTETTVSVMLIGAVFIITPSATIAVAVLLLSLILITNSLLKTVLKNEGLNYQDAAMGMNKWLLQSIQGIKELKVMRKDSYFQQQYYSYGKRYVNSYRRYCILSMVPRFLIEAVSMCTVFIIVAAVIYKGADLESIIPVMTAVAMAAMRLLPSVNRISASLASISYNEPMLDKLIESLKDISGENDVTFEADLIPGPEDRKNIIFKFEKEIKLCDLSYHYPANSKWILEKANVSIKRGETVGFIGASGSGKTTTADILLGLLKPQSGRVTADDTDIRADTKGWLKQIGYIPQMIFMMDDTITANVAFGVFEEEISMERVWLALKEASLDKFVEGLPDKLETQIGERGVRLSGGQRQRIGIARALYQNSEILIFDEATSALDNETEMAIMESIRALQGRKTMIIIAHRLSTVESCDHIYRVENGKIIKER